MANFRMDRVNSELARGIAEVITNEMNNPAVDGKIISVLSVETSKDLTYSKVMLNIMGSKAEQDKALKAIQNAGGFIRAGLKKRVVLHHYPMLDFRIDEGYEAGNKLIDKINKLNISEEE